MRRIDLIRGRRGKLVFNFSMVVVFHGAVIIT